jgi:hypothetical protein
MSVRKIVAAKVAAKPTGKGAPEPVRRAHAKKVAGPPHAKSTPNVIEDVSAAAEKLAADIDRALAAGRTDMLTADAIQALMAVACRSYSAQVEAGGNFLPLAARNQVTSTDVMVTASGLLKSANLAVFELGMWQSWTGR